MPELHSTHNNPPNLRNAILNRNAVQSPLGRTGVNARHTMDSLDLDEIRYDCEKSVLFEGGKKCISIV